ncbi:Uncharacterised protein [Vibrio cholerae]|uniref:Uncharacterized protein n=1 Tax=Vibrio cholerae TaxID=666 RepID=A0A655Z0Q5_VIBCL|nr:Uncharacterised protein [Vibrio cholerae]
MLGLIQAKIALILDSVTHHILGDQVPEDAFDVGQQIVFAQFGIHQGIDAGIGGMQPLQARKLIQTASGHRRCGQQNRGLGAIFGQGEPFQLALKDQLAVVFIMFSQNIQLVEIVHRRVFFPLWLSSTLPLSFSATI